MSFDSLPFVRRCLLISPFIAAAVFLVATPPALRADGPGLGNLTYGSHELFSTIATFTSANQAPAGHGFVAMHRGYLAVIYSNDGGGGNGSGGFTFYNVSNPRSPVVTFTTRNNPTYSTAGLPNYAGHIREAHGFSFYKDFVCLPTNTRNVGGTNTGLQFWDWSSIDPPNANPVKVSSIDLPGLTGGDYSPTPWWVFWQGGRYVYVAGTSGGLYIVDASNPAAPVLANRGPGLPNPIPTSQLGGFRLNTVFAVGNLLVTSASDASGLATYDISDPLNPILLHQISPGTGLYSIMVNGDRILGAHDPARIWSISNPANISLIGSGPNIADKGGYGTFQDGVFHFGSSSCYIKLDISSLPFTVIGTNAPAGFSNPDWDFATALGNLVFQGNDHSGSALVVHQTGPDTNGPLVNMVVPRHNSTNQALTSRVGLTFTDEVDARTISTNSVIVRPVGGSALPGRYSYQTSIINFWPDQPFQPNATYEVVVPAGGLRDLVNNAASLSFTSRFSTVIISNVPLTCTATAAPPAVPWQTVHFNAMATGSGTLLYSWNFGDGSPPTAFSPSSAIAYSYANPGHYSVTVTVTNGSAQANASFVQTIHRPLTAGSPAAASTIILDAVSNRVWVVNTDADTVTAIHATNYSKVLEKPVGRKPRTLGRAPDGTIWVVNQDDATISVLSRSTGDPVQAPIALPYGSRPYGVVFSPDNTAAYVTLQGTGKLLRLNPATRAITGTTDVGPTPRGVAVSADSQRILVTRFISPDAQGEVVEVSGATLEVVRTFGLAIDAGPDLEDSGRGLPNFLSSITISPDGVRAWVPSKKDNIQRGLYRDGLPLNFESTVRSIVSQLDLEANVEDVAGRQDLNDRDMAFAACFSPIGDYVFVAVQGGNAVDVLDAYNGERVTAMEPTGLAPQGLVISPDGRRLYVNNFMSRTVRVYDVSGIVASTNNLAPMLATVATVANETLSPQVLLGKQIFYNAEDGRMNRDSYISCASCHLDGEHDGRVWDFTDRGEGLRNTITLLGRHGTGQGRVHWTGNFDEIQDFEHDIRGPFAGEGFLDDADFNSGTRNHPLGDSKAGLSADLDALAAYVSSLTNVNASPFRNGDGSLTADALAGKAIFADRNCASCHTGNQFTDSTANLLLDVGTIKASSGQRLGQPLTGFDTPTLKGIWETAPYFHDGSAATLMDVFAPTNGHHGGLTSGLSEAERQQLVEYLLQIDDSELVNTAPTVTLASPANGSHYGLPANVVLTAMPSSANAIRSVEFFSGGILLARITNTPFSLLWSNPPPGSHVVTARVTDVLGDFGWSAAATITVSEGSGYSLYVNFQPENAPIPVGYAADFGEPFGLRTNGISYGWNTNTIDTRWRTNAANPSPDLRYATLNHLQKPANPNAVWEAEIPNGTYFVFAVSGDADNFNGYFDVLVEGLQLVNGAPNSGNRWVQGSNTVTVTDGRLTISNGPLANNSKICFIDVVSLAPSNSMPMVTLVNPVDESTYAAPANIVISADASDTDGTVQRVDFYAGTNWLGASVTAPHTLNWNNVPAGVYSLRAYATDNAGGTVTSTPVTVNIELPPHSPFFLSTPVRDGGTVQFSFSTENGRTYTVEYTDSLNPPQWETLETVLGDGFAKIISDQATNSARFYRVSAEAEVGP